MIPIGDGNADLSYTDCISNFIETDMIPIGDGNYVIKDVQFGFHIETDMIPIGDGNFSRAQSTHSFQIELRQT